MGVSHLPGIVNIAGVRVSLMSELREHEFHTVAACRYRSALIVYLYTRGTE